ncbi:hypothetical protein [Bacillus pseudomycoides]|uniref:hypothetical protein n=1 Tax=Bacillus pseudomycoides TaxID=64104 RepID=UPI0015CF4271|nr:hypothetical protein [Bacillus pseudomycoides]
MDFNIIAFIVREGYEIKTWLNVESDISDEELKIIALEKFSSLGVEVKENDFFQFEEF